MGIKSITGSLFTDWQWLSQPCQTAASVFKSSLQGAKPMEPKKIIFTEEQCGLVCQSQDFVGTSQWMVFRKGWKPTSYNRGTVRHTTTPLYPSKDVNQALGLPRSQESSTRLDISSLWTSPKAKSQTVPHNTNKVTLWC